MLAGPGSSKPTFKAERFPLASRAGPVLTHARVRAVRIAGLPVVYVGD